MKYVVLLTGCCVALAACGGSSAGTPERAGSTSRPSASPSDLPAQAAAVVKTGDGPSTLVVGSRAVYVGTHRAGSVQRIDPTTNTVTGEVAVGGQLNLEQSTTGGGLEAIADGSPLWACTNVDGVLNQVSTTQSKVLTMVPAKCDGGTRNRIGRTLWATSNGDAHELLLLDAASGKVLRRLSLPGPDYGPAVAAGKSVLIAGPVDTLVLSLTGTGLHTSAVATPGLTSTGGHLYRLAQDGPLEELDPATLAVLHSWPVPARGDTEALLAGDGAGHVYYRPSGTEIVRIDTTSGQVEPFVTLPEAEVATAIAWAFGSLWVTNFTDNTVWRVRP